MKELSIEEKSKRYDKAIEVARKIKNGERINVPNGTPIPIAIFPELEETEDDMIRKEIIAFLKEGKPYHCPNSVKRQEWAVWLEKQGESYTKRDIDDAYLKGIADVKREVEKIDEQTEKMKKEIAEFIFNSKEDIKQRYEWIKCLGFDVKFSNEEKQDGQKPDKVEPKFKVKYAGSEYNVFETKDIAGVTFYGIEDEPNHIDYVKADNCEIISGDYGIKENGSPYPTKPAKFSEQKPDYCHHEVDLSDCSEDYTKGYYDGWNNCNQQHSQLKVEQKPTDITDEWIEEYWQHEKVNNPYSYNKGDEIQFDYQGFVSFCKKYCQKLAWSEEDERIYQSIMDDTVQENQLNDEQTNWLKDIKYHYFPQLKQEWDKEDCNQIETIACHLDNIGNGAMAELLLNIMNKYKSCRPQNTWKPSDEQMKALSIAMCGVNDPLFSLYQDLLKLKE